MPPPLNIWIISGCPSIRWWWWFFFVFFLFEKIKIRRGECDSRANTAIDIMRACLAIKENNEAFRLSRTKLEGDELLLLLKRQRWCCWHAVASTVSHTCHILALYLGIASLSRARPLRRLRPTLKFNIFDTFHHEILTPAETVETTILSHFTCDKCQCRMTIGKSTMMASPQPLADQHADCNVILCYDHVRFVPIAHTCSSHHVLFIAFDREIIREEFTVGRCAVGVGFALQTLSNGKRTLLLRLAGCGQPSAIAVQCEFNHTFMIYEF